MTICIYNPSKAFFIVYSYKYYISGWGDNGWKTTGDENGDNLAVQVLSCEKAVAPKLRLDDVPKVSNGQVTFSVTLDDPYEFADNPKIKVMRDGEEIQVTQTDTGVSVSDNLGQLRRGGYTVDATSNNGIDIMSLYIPVWNEETPFDWHNAILYFAFTDRFNNGSMANDAPLGIENDWKGGDFVGLRAMVENGYFDKLGVNALWISSVSMNTQKAAGTASAYHSYWPITTGYTEKTAPMFEGAKSNNVNVTPIEPHFGTLDELRALGFHGSDMPANSLKWMLVSLILRRAYVELLQQEVTLDYPTDIFGDRCFRFLMETEEKNPYCMGISGCDTENGAVYMWDVPLNGEMLHPNLTPARAGRLMSLTETQPETENDRLVCAEMVEIGLAKKDGGKILPNFPSLDAAQSAAVREKIRPVAREICDGAKGRIDGIARIMAEHAPEHLADYAKRLPPLFQLNEAETIMRILCEDGWLLPVRDSMVPTTVIMRNK